MIVFSGLFFKNHFPYSFYHREYLPPNITKFNAYAVHGNKWGEETPAEKDKSYETLFPTDPAVSGKSGPDFHYLPGFQGIDLSQIGYEEQREYSPLWKTVIADGDHEFT